ncbi:ferredoxin [Micromonospora sagamiensis]|uniref:Ferredoxin n=1 Tax=Micromonospora sagamiensis TaxID=47875 RepID=A0A562WH62_9ACTN|nr:ferredoxin [Micromonospora sagamiensis]TWJ29227.1 ferredoxin [Micromonospora sagamiensis]BCL17748.1 ferredoxin [Micromonospora sagamiensis]
MRITVDAERCVGSGMCVLTVGEVFDQQDDGRAVVLRPEPPAGTWDAVREAVDLCPAAAIVLSTERRP